MSKTTAPSKNSAHLLYPREHGAYALMALPQLTALILGAFSIPSILLALTVVSGFLLHEPVLILMGRRGRRIWTAAAGPARRRARDLILGGLICGAAGLMLSPPAAWVAAMIMAACGAVVVLLITRGLEKTVFGEVVVALTFSLALLPTAIAGGVAAGIALIAAGVWGFVFSLATLTVKAIIDRYKNRRTGPSVVLAGLALVTVAIIAAAFFRGAGAGRVLLAIIPAAATVLLVVLLGLTPKKLRWLGWSLVVSNTLTLVLILVALM